MLKVWIKSTALFSLSICVLCACSERNFREEFFKNRRLRRSAISMFTGITGEENARPIPTLSIN